MFGLLLLRRSHAALAAGGITAGMLAWTLWSVPSSPAKPVDPARLRAWEKITPRLRQAEESGAEFGKRQRQHVKDFFAEKNNHARDFGDEVTGWGGKWAYVKGVFTGDDGKAQQAHIKQSFERHIFTDRDIKELLKGVITAYLSELEGQENSLLVEIQADLGEQDMPALRDLLTQQGGAGFRTEFQNMVTQVAPVVGRDVKIGLGREAAVWIGSDIAAAIGIRIASAAAVRLGVSGGILGTGAASSVATFGVGLGVCFVVDAVVDKVMREAGYDPSGQIAKELTVALSRIENLLLEGDQEGKRVYHKLRRLQDHDRFEFVRAECKKSADRMDASGTLGLQHELDRLRQTRCRLREAALKKLILEGARS